MIVEKKKNRIPAFLIDSSAMKSIFEGKDFGKELIDSLFKVKKEGMPHLGFTTMSNFLRAIYTSDREFFDLDRVKKVLDVVRVLPSMADFKDEKKVMKETIEVANAMSRGKKDE